MRKTRKTMKTRKNRKTRKGGSGTPPKSHFPTLPTTLPSIVEEVPELMYNTKLTSDDCKKRIEILYFLYNSERDKYMNLIHALKKKGINTITLTVKKY